MRTETEILDVILQTAKVLQVDAVALSGSRATPKALRMSSKTMMWSTS